MTEEGKAEAEVDERGQHSTGPSTPTGLTCVHLGKNPRSWGIVRLRLYTVNRHGAPGKETRL